MKTIITSALRAAALATTLFLLPAAFAQSADHAALQLAATGSVKVESVGSYVSVGTYRVQVSAKLGHPSATLPDGTWLYEGFAGDNSAAAGTLVVRFNAGRVTSLTLAAPAVVTALRTQPVKLENKVLVADWSQR